MARTIFDAETPTLRPLQLAAPDIEKWLLARDPKAIDHYKGIGPKEYARSFTAARTAGTAVVDDLYYALVDNVSRGGSEQDFTKLVVPTLKAKGWLGGDAGQIASRVALIYDTNLRLARSAGRWDRYQRTKQTFPYLKAFTAEDSRVRHPPKSPHADHRAWDGIILPMDHSFWTRWWPPIGFRCRCGVQQMSRSDLARTTGITSTGDLADREARLGTPVFATPAMSTQAQLASMVVGTNGDLMPGMPAVDPQETQAQGEAMWRNTALQALGTLAQDTIDALFGK